MDSFSAALALLPQKYAAAIHTQRRFSPEELRLRVGQPLALCAGGEEIFLQTEPIAENDLLRVLERATGASLYSAAEAMRQGYFCVGPLRIGICGQATAEGRGEGFRVYSSLCIRLGRDCRGVCREAARALWRDGFVNTLILSPPGGGKTTALRDLIRILSEDGRRIGVVDERGELSGGVFELGRHCDVISGMDKLSGALLLLRSMTPQIIAADEISAPEDVKAIEEIFSCGTGVLATAHARSSEDLQRRAAYRRLIENAVFERALVIRNDRGKRTYEVKELL